MTGYRHPGYAQSLARFGTPRELPRCEGWILERQIPGFPHYDAMGCYPLFTCQDWSQLCADLNDIGNELVSLALVTDPFGRFDPTDLQKCFDLVIPFKGHFVADLSQPMHEIVSKHHRYYARKALKVVEVERCLNATHWLDEWVELYNALIERHNITGIRAFSREAFAKQLDIPGMVMFRAVSQGITVGVNLFYVQEKVAYTHLSAFSPDGYDLRAAYAIRWAAIEYLADRVRWLDLGAGAGIASNGTDGLSRFKQGWSTDIRTAYFCGRIFDQTKYREITRARGIPETDYFPAYRHGEFT